MIKNRTCVTVESLLLPRTTDTVRRAYESLAERAQLTSFGWLEEDIVMLDTETTGLDRINDHIVGASLYCPGQPECYIPMKHLIPIFDQPYKDQLTYEQVGAEFQRFVDAKTKLIFANADFDIAMIYHE